MHMKKKIRHDGSKEQTAKTENSYQQAQMNLIFSA